MRCEHCGVEIGCKTDVCPLCHEPIACDEHAETAFPVGKIKKRRPDMFSHIYCAAASLIALASVLLNVLLFDEGFMWSMIVVVCLIYIYYCVRFTFLAQMNFNVIIFGQTIALTALFVAVRLIVGGNHFIFITWLPIVYFIDDILLIAYVFLNWKEVRKKIMSLIVTGVLGVIPVCAAYIFDLSVKLPSIIVSALSGVLVIVTVICGRKHIWGELKRYFHL